LSVFGAISSIAATQKTVLVRLIVPFKGACAEFLVFEEEAAKGVTKGQINETNGLLQGNYETKRS